MASPQASCKLFSNEALYAYDHDPADASVATEIAWVDMRDFEYFAVLLFTSVLGGTGPTAFTIIANAESDGSGTDVSIKTHAIASSPDAVGDFLVLQCTAEEIAQEAADAGVANARYVTAVVTCNNTADECVVFYQRAGCKRARRALTADHVS
jgi:hypothetical protein